ncbi:hypothetical protein OESDEN_12544 [Oesophagostomum dentatum]|uniref:Uncharacterized protein n=1 Tax=Oesophagostomum dentatum TaxID=61180 RepID=A0A0B1SRX2_OESDE|nr:hypothetical protein OESDEN_12544 [Oesophagostomum dentatum]
MDKHARMKELDYTGLKTLQFVAGLKIHHCENYVPFRDYASTIKRMDKDARMKELDYTGLKTLQFVAGLKIHHSEKSVSECFIV